jgi:RNA polymerase sigma factor (sigma-70 family)
MTALVVDPALLDAARIGDARAIDDLLVACQPNIRRYAQRSCTITVIDDAVQEALLVLSRHVTQLRHPAALSSWLFAIVRRECRRLGRALVGIDLWEESRVDAWSDGKPDPTLRLEVARALESLPADFREVIVLRDFEGLTVSEIAQRLAISRAAVKSRIHRARSLTREYLAP